jgi:hypothetical protein
MADWHKVVFVFTGKKVWHQQQAFNKNGEPRIGAINPLRQTNNWQKVAY